MSALFDVNDVPAHCVQCSEDIEDMSELRDGENQCHQCYINQACPGQCNAEHGGPEPDCDGQWVCETDDILYNYIGDALQRGYNNINNWHEAGRWSEGSRLIGGYWYDAEQVYPCYSCGDSIHEDHARWDESNEEYYCYSCYNEREDERNEYDEDDGGTTTTAACSSCTSPYITHFDPITEDTYCTEHAGPKAERIDGDLLVAV